MAERRRRLASNIPRKLARNFMDEFIYDRFLAGYGPKVNAGTLRQMPNMPNVSATWLYALIDRAYRGGIKDRGLLLRRKYKKMSPLRSTRYAGVHIIPARIDIAQRSSEVMSRKTFGHREADTIVGKARQGANVTVVELNTREGFCRHVTHRTKQQVADALIDVLAPVAIGVKTITFDNGGEFTGHVRVAQQLDYKTYFARSYRSCDRGTNEHFNGILRHCYPKSMSLRDISHMDLAKNVAYLNQVPCEILGFKSPQELFDEAMHALRHPPPR